MPSSPFHHPLEKVNGEEKNLEREMVEEVNGKRKLQSEEEKHKSQSWKSRKIIIKMRNEIG